MEDRTALRHTCLFVAFLLLAGAANLFSRTGNPALDGLMTSCNYLIYIGLLLYWCQSVRARLLPSRARNRIVGAALLMVLYQLLRVFKYRMAVEPAAERYAVYLYFTPMSLIPTLFLMTCLHIRRGSRAEHRDEALLLIPPGLLSLLALFNDLHGLVYTPGIPLSEFRVDSGTYSAGPVFYVIYAWMILSFAAGLILLFRENRMHRRDVLPYLTAVVALWFILLTLSIRMFEGTQIPRMYNNPEIHMFGMLGVFEVCIRGRMIPHNEDYPGFFRTLQIPALVTDRTFRPVYRSGGEFTANTDQLRAALVSPVCLTPDLKLSGHNIRGGFAFWAEDETEVHRAQERLADANELIESENSLIQAETEQREKDAWLQSRHRIYHEIAEIMYPCQQRIEGLLARMEPDTPAFRSQLAFVSVLNAYVKRKTNLLLLAAEKDSLSVRDLFLSLKESANYLSLAGLQTGVLPPEEQTLPAGRVITLYDAFEAIAEQLIGRASSLMVSWKDSDLTLATETDRVPDTAGLPAAVRLREEEGILYMDLSAQKGGDTA
ncbi:MAG: hypothetical protein K5922_04905 [Clostridiales bacterium]|nr:hypothetical protein [Clostridiales bacterium]